MSCYITGDKSSITTAILIKDSAYNKASIQKYYIDPLVNLGLSQDNFVVIALPYQDGKCLAKFGREALQTIAKTLEWYSVKYLLIADSTYFKLITKIKKPSTKYGYALPGQLIGYEKYMCVLSTNYKSIFTQLNAQENIDTGNQTLSSYILGTYTIPGMGIIHGKSIPKSNQEIKGALDSLLQYPKLTLDIETYSLALDQAGIGTVAIAWDKHNGICFDIDMAKHEPNIPVRQLLKEFLCNYSGTLMYHGATFDIKILVFVLFMQEDFTDIAGLLDGLAILTRSIDDTLLITYLSTNSTLGNTLGLKANVQEFAGDYAEDDIKDISRIPRDDLLTYNLIDALSTWYLYEKKYPILVADDQEAVYQEHFLPMIKVIIQMELIGMPLDMDAARYAHETLSQLRDGHLSSLASHPLISAFTTELRRTAQIKRNSELKTKVKSIEDFAYIHFNPNSDKQIQVLLHEYFDLPIVDTTKGGAPATGVDTLNKHLVYLKAKTNLSDREQQLIQILENIIGIGEVSGILDTFINAFLTKSIKHQDGISYLHGNFNIGGTISARLSSSKPNLQNQPSTGTKYAKIVKQCFKAPTNNWLFIGADYSSLEDKISALTTNDPNKQKVYLEGYDGHCLRAYSYFRDEMPNIEDTVEGINSIQHKCPKLRQASKGPTFALTYSGMWKTLVVKFGMSEQQAKQIEARYHELYQVSDQWVHDKIVEASEKGYATLAFGVRLRTPMLAKVVIDSSKMPYEARAEARSVGNALGQSWGQLNNRAAVEFMGKVWQSKYRTKILPIAHIHDAQYFLIENSYGCVKWVNDHLIKAMEWQDDPMIYHPDIALGGKLEIFYPSWAEGIPIDNYISKLELHQKIEEYKNASHGK